MSTPLQIITVNVNGLNLARFSAYTFDMDIQGETVVIRCGVRDTQAHPVIVDQTAAEAIGTGFKTATGEPTTLKDLACNLEAHK